VLSTLIGATAALALQRGGLKAAHALTACFLSPLILPAILTGLALFQIYLLCGIGRPVWGLIMGHTVVAVPYVIRTTLAVLHNFDRRLEEAAAALGAGPVQVFFEVTLPLIRPGVIAGGIFAFIVSFDQFPVSLFLVVPNAETLPVVLFNYPAQSPPIARRRQCCRSHAGRAGAVEGRDRHTEDHNLGRKVGRDHEGLGPARLREGVEMHGAGGPGIPLPAQIAGKPPDRPHL
jgi:hypothetical protein